MASRGASSWEDDDVLQLQSMASKLGDMLRTHGKKEREEWDKLHGVLGKIAGYLSIADRRMSIQALLLKLEENMGRQNQGNTNADALLLKMMVIFEEKVAAENADASKAIRLLKDLIILVAKELNMFPLCDSIHTEMIQEYTFYEEKVKHLVKWSDELSTPNAPYTVVSIVGAQSSGKSYLLNQLFGTDFPVMNAVKGRSQTTRGILISRCIRPSLLVLDVEGFDGRERGQDTSFEKQAALFALTTSDLMMVNISVHDVGREQGGGATLFKTIFQERTKLPPGLTKIIVVIRNYDGETPLNILEEDVMDSLEEMWKSVHVGLNERVIFKDYIKVQVVALPEKKSWSFREEVTKLRKLLSESTLDHNESDRIQVSSFSASSKLLWDDIKQNKRLDLPSHKVMIATVYCEQIVDEAIKGFASHKDYKILRAQETPQGFAQASNKLLEVIIAKYNQETDMYDAAVREKQGQRLKDEINKSLAKYCRELIHKMRQKTSEQFKNEFVTTMKTMEVSDDLISYQDQKLKSCRENFFNMCGELKLFDEDYLHTICRDLQEELQSFTTYQILGVKEECVRKEVELALQRADKNVQEVLDKLKDMQLEGQRMKEEMDCEKVKQENELKLARAEAEREHQKLTKELEEKNRRLQEDAENIKKLNDELEKKQENWCTIL